MPIAPRLPDDEREITGDELVASAIADVEQFVNSSAWKRSRRGNLWRIFDGRTLTIFKRDDDSFSFCISDGEETEFSKVSYDDEADALYSLAERLSIGE